MPDFSDIRAELERELPPVTLLAGPLTERLMLVAARAAWHHGVHRSDIITCWPPLTVMNARNLVSVAGVRPYGPFKAIIAGIDSSSEQALDILLKVLEEPPDSVRFLLVASHPQSLALLSRCRVYQVSAGVTEEPGREDSREDADAAVSAALRAALTRDPAVLCEALRSWGSEDTGQRYLSQLRRRARQAFGSSDRQLSEEQAVTVLQVLTAHSRARPQNVAMTALSLAFLEGS